MKEIELTMNTVLRPNAAASRPPIAEPIARLKLHVVELSAFATSTSFLPRVMFGISAWRPGSNNAQKTVSAKRRI